MARARKSTAVTRPAEPGPAAEPGPVVEPAAVADPDPVVALGQSCGIRDGASLRQQLLGLLGHPQPVVIDAGAVERIDTAALQLLFAFERDRAAAGRTVSWRAASAAFSQALTTLGLALGAGGPAAQ